MKNPITVWRFDQAPKELQGLSTNGGDEDWIAEVPSKFAREYIAWLEKLGCCEVHEYRHPTKKGWKVRIGCHA